MRPTRVVLAPDSFKGSATSVQVAEALARGWRSVRPDDELVVAPMADGGEGTVDAVAAAVPGATPVPVRVTGPGGDDVDTHWLLLPDGSALVELAACSGIALLAEPAPLTAHTRGFGQAIAAALDHGVPRLLLALGGSCSTDGGVGALRELGARPVDAAGGPAGDGGAGLADLAALHLDGLRALPPDGVEVLTDVDSPLLGPLGAAHVFGPQKGATPDDLEVLEAAMARLAAVVAGERREPGLEDRPGAGAAGGSGFGLLAWGASLVLGADRVASLSGLAERIAAADLVVTGEGRYDAQSAAGKVPWHVRGLAEAAGVPVALVAGSVDAATGPFWAARSVLDSAGSLDEAMRRPLDHLEQIGADLAAAFGAAPR
ncbi:MAG: glycerate kinase [Nocardioidaceae bacterium]|nr:glycerate kinase [Nocardioidaceae bacterium]